jgi:hypothetical protein
MTNTMSATMIDYLLSVAREHPLMPPSADTPTPVAIFRAVATNPDGITRHGLDAMMDALFSDTSFALPAYENLLKHPVEYQNEIAAELEISQQPTAFQAQWSHIIVPAWNQHAELRKVLEATRS